MLCACVHRSYSKTTTWQLSLNHQGCRHKAKVCVLKSPRCQKRRCFRMHLPLKHSTGTLSLLYHTYHIQKLAGLDTLQRRIKYCLTASKAVGASKAPFNIHRLDAPTTGLVVCAKTRVAGAKLSGLFADRAVDKRCVDG